MAIPLIMIGLVQCVVGYSDYARRDYQMNNVAYNLGMNKKGVIEKEEGPRMKKVIVNFVIYRWVEIALAAAGAVMFLKFRGSPGKVFLYGVGIILSIQSLLMLGADYFAEQRGKIYTNELE